jgi:hypothetical protein
MRVSPSVRKNIVVDNYHCRFVLPTDDDSPSSQPFTPPTSGDDVLPITAASPYGKDVFHRQLIVRYGGDNHAAAQ